MSDLPKPLFNFSTHNEDFTVERELVEVLGPKCKTPLRVLSVGGCGTHVAAMCASPDVGQVDAVDVAPPQLMLGELVRTAMATLSSADEMAVFIGNSGKPEERRDMYARIRESLSDGPQRFWDGNQDSVESGLMHLGGAERCYGLFREHLPTSDLEELARAPEVVAKALAGGLSLDNISEFLPTMPKAVSENMAKHGVPMIAESLSARLAELSSGEIDLIVEVIVHGTFVMNGASSRPAFLREDVFAEVQQNGCGRDRLAFHQGPIQKVGVKLAKEHGAYDLADMSNILDVAPAEQAVEIVRGTAEAVRSGGVLLCRAHGAPGTVAEVFTEAGLKVDEELSAAAQAAESSFFIGDACVAFV